MLIILLIIIILIIINHLPFLNIEKYFLSQKFIFYLNLVYDIFQDKKIYFQKGSNLEIC